MTRRRPVLLTAAALVVAAVALAAVLLIGSGGDEQRDGPLYAADANEVAISVRPGATLTFGQPIYRNSSSEPLRLLEARLVGPGAGALDVVDVRTAGVDRELGGIGVDRVFPPSDADGLGELRPLRGTPVPPAAGDPADIGVELLFALKAPAEGRHVVRGVEVTYEAGGETYTDTLPDALSVCVVTPPEPETADCPFPGTPEGDVG